MRQTAIAICLLPVLARGALACDTALILTMDVSHSVDASEYRLQIDGTADALRDPEVIEALVQGQVALALVQWSGAGEQELSLPWARMTSAAAVADFAARTRALPRAFTLSNTAPAEAVYFALSQFADVADCDRKIIDVSGDGTANAGSAVPAARLAAERRGVTINAVAIESMGMAITSFYQRHLITRDGFVLTARRHGDYPRAIRQKILREVSRIIG
jgi:Ca-activated chloride channel homolog